MPSRWSSNAETRSYQIESGLDITFNKVFKPIFLEKILQHVPKNILEIGAGTGHLAKELSRFDYKITAIEPSEGMYLKAKDVLSDTFVELINCSSFDLQKNKEYDIVLSHLVAHVVDDLILFLKSIETHISKNGKFIFSIPHPCFYNDYKKLFGQEYNYMTPIKKEISFKITKDAKNIISGVPYHHRPLSDYINSIINAGLIIDSFDEIFPEINTQLLYGSLWITPRYCMFTCRKKY